MLNTLRKNATLVGDPERNGDLDLDERVRQSTIKVIGTAAFINQIAIR